MLSNAADTWTAVSGTGMVEVQSLAVRDFISLCTTMSRYDAKALFVAIVNVHSGVVKSPPAIIKAPRKDNFCSSLHNENQEKCKPRVQKIGNFTWIEAIIV